MDFSPAWAGFGEADRSAWLEITTNDPALPSARTLLPAIAFEVADVLETFTYGSSAQADWLLLTDSPLDGLEPALEELLANTLSELSAAGLQVNIAAVGPDDTCPSTRPAFVTNEDSATSQAAFLVASLPLDAPEVEPDSLLEHAAAVLAESGPEGCLAGWRRAQRQLHVVLLTRSDASAAASQAEQLQQLTQAAGSASVVVSVLGAVGDVSCTGFDLPVSYLQAADETGGAALDLCRTGWSESASELGTPSTRLLNGDFTWFLQEVPLPESIELKADGISTPAASGWSYDAELNAVIIEDYLDLSTGTDIELRYMAALECEAS